MSELSKDTIEQALAGYVDPHLDKDLVSTKCVKDIQIDGDKVRVEVVLGYPAAGFKQQLESILRDRLAEAGAAGAEVKVSWKIEAHSVQQGVKRMANVKNMIAVASGKGGVGKSTTAVNLALALAAEGARVGVLDADIYGPSQPRMLGFLIDEETPMIWRGPMVTQALEQLLNDTNWDDLDYLVIDLPPGTGDTQLTLAQKVPVSGAVIVTTPQDIALLDARKGLKMFQKVEVPILGIVENMSIHICSKCGHEEHIFGTGGGGRMADEQDVDFLGSLPLDIHIREQADGGKPSVVADPDSRIAEIYREIARRMAARLAQQAKDFSAKFPNIVIQNS